MRLTQINKLLLLSISLALAACNGGSGGSSSGGGDTTASSQSLTGGGIKGPLVNAIVTVYEVDASAADFKGAVVGTPGSTNAQAQIQNLALPFPLTPPYILEFTSDTNTTDILTGKFPVISEMRTVLTAELLEAGDQIYATPLTTMAVDLAIKNADVDAGVWASNERNLDPDGDGNDDFTISLGDSNLTADELLTALPIAAAQVKSTMGFGMDEDIDIFDTPPLIDNTTNNEAKQEKAAAYRAAVEAVTAVVSQIDIATGTDDANSVLSSLTADLADGQIDGKFDDENGDQQTSEIFGGTDEDAEETANAALELLEQDPATLPIPNDPQGRTVGQMKQVINDEKEDLGNDEVETEINTTEEVELKPAETNPDIDGDGVPNDKDAFPEDPSETKDTDKDGLGNNADTDDDNDGVIDANDAFPLNPAEQTDTDGDGIGNNADTDDDGDGVEDSADDFPLDKDRQNKSDQDNDGWPSEQDADDNDASVPGTEFIDTDLDGLGNDTDTDDDNDGVADTDDAFPLNPSEQKDTDGDGIGDNADTDIDGDGVANADDKFPRNPFETKDTDRDGIGNNTDEDDDGDGIDDAQEVQNGTDPLKRDTDGDGVLDNADQAPTDPDVQFDSDKDGIDNKNDNCPVHYNPSQSNIDGDTRGDACDKDKDGDGVENPQDAFPEDSSETLDTDGDGIGNNEDTDDDNDGVADVDDAFPLDATETKDTDSDGTGDNADTDRDGDGVDNAQDAFPNDPSEDTDTDGDGIGNNTDDDIDGDGIANDVDDFPLNASASADTDGDGEPNNTDSDDDGDGVDDVNDAFPLNANETTDTDGDGIGDNADGDIDGDGVVNDDDRFPFDKNEYLDTDGDGTGDNADTDRDGDGTDNSADAFPLNPSESIDTDGDGIGNNADTDDDNDGLSDAAEAGKGTNPLVRDTDADGRRDNLDNCPIDPNTDQKDVDGDGLGDVCDDDDDNDQVPDSTDNCPLTPNANQNDQDNDGKGDACDTDRDGDGVLNTVDNCPTTENADQLDANNNGIGDACDADADQDGVVDELDNCPADANPDQLDTDSDKQGNVCDTDDDNDGLTDSEEAEKGTNPLKADTDNDGVNDKNDAFPIDPSETKDTDGDGTGDNADNNKDTDSHIDSEDNCPLINNEDQLDTDSDGKGDVCDNDDDGDGVNDSADAFPLDPAESQDQDGDQIGDKADNCPLTSNNDQADSDQDGKGDVCDNDNDNDGVADAVDNCPAVPNPGQLNKDGDEQGDVCDTDDDNDNVEDSADNCPLVANEDQANQDGDAFGDACDSDRDGDGLSNADENALATDPDAVDSDDDGTNDGADNCPATPNSDQANTDGDTKGNACDADDDNDGVLDGDDAFPEDANESADSDSDTIGDNADNCPVTANQDQADADNDGVGDVCDDLPQVATFYLNERIVDSETETDDTGVEGGVCPFDTGDEMTRVSLWLQDGAAIKVSFGDDGLDGGSEVSIDTAGNITGTMEDSHGDENGSMALTINIDGQLDSSTGVITVAVDEEFTFTDASDSQIASCVYSSTETFTPMAQAQASSIFEGQSGTNVGFVWMDAWEDHNSGSSSDSTASMASSFEFSYGIIDDTDENEFVYDASASTADKWMLHTDVESSFMLGATGWVSVADQHVVEGTPGATMNLVAKDASENILANWLVTPFSAAVTNEPMLGLVPRAWSEEGLTAPQEVFAGSDVLALGIHAVSQFDVYEVRCPEHDDMGEADSTLDCQNAMLKSDGADGLTYATGLGDIIHSPGSAMTQKWQGVPAGYMEEGEVFAYLTGSDASGAEASTGSASFYQYDWETDALIDLGVVSSWTIVDPNNNDTDLLIKFTLPELVSEQFEGGDKPDAMIVALLEDTSDSQLYVRGGHFREAGRNFYESGLNSPAIEEVKGNFNYVGDTDGDGIKDDVDTDDDGDGVEDSEDAFPLDPSESKDTDGDGTGDNADTDADGDGISNEEELQNGTDPLLADTDEDGVNDDTDNCPTIANGANEDNQADSDSNGVGDACDGSADVSGFWKIQRTITSISHSGDTTWCEGAVDDVEAAVVLIKQDGANIDILFADNEFQADGDIGTVNAAAELNWSAEDNFNEYFNTDGSFSGSVEDTWSFSGTADDATSPMVITDTNAVEVNILYDGEDQTGSILSNCEFTYTASMTRMNQVNAADVLAAGGTHQGMAYTESDHQYVFETDEDVFEFGYGLIDTANGEQGFEWNDVNQTWDQFTPDADYMLSALGWGEVEDRIQVNGTPGETADLVVSDGVSTFSTMRIKTFEAMLNGMPYEGFVEEDLLDKSFDPSGMFADADSKAIAIEAENLTDAYRIPCDVHDQNYQDLGLACTNAYIKDWSNWPTISQTDLAISLADALHATSAVSDIDDKGLWIGRTHGGDNAKSVYAFLTGSDISGATGTSGTVSFTTHFFDGETYHVDAIQDQSSDITATWEITEPHAGFQVLSFDIPEALFEKFDIEWREDPTVIMAAVEAGDTQSFLRFGGMRPAGKTEIFQLLNFTALEEVIAGFNYVRPDTDNDDVSDDEDNCPTEPNTDQTDADGNGKGDACDGGGTADDAFTAENIEGDFLVTFPDSEGFQTPYTFNSDGTGVVFFSDGPQSGESFTWTVDINTLVLVITTETSEDLDKYTLTSGTVDQGAIEAVVDEGNDGSVEATVTAEWKRGSASSDADNDGVENSVDNCPFTPNGVNEDDQANLDGDEFGNACDADIDGDGTANESDPCPNDQFDQCSTSSSDSDNDGVNDDLDPFPYNPNETADSDEDGLGDNQDDFPNDASEQFDTDGDGVGDNADLCPLVASSSEGVNHNDTDSNGIGDECDISVADLSGIWLLTGNPDGTNEIPDETGESCVADENAGVFYSKAQIKQVGTQVWMHLEEDTFVGTIAANGDFSLKALHDDTPTEISGNYDGANFTGFGYIESETVTSGSCTGMGTLAMTMGAEASEELVLTNGGISWFESDSHDDSTGTAGTEFFYGTLEDNTAAETMHFFNKETQSWETQTETDTNHYLTENGLATADDRFAVNGYVDSTAGHTAIIQPTDQGSLVSFEISHVDFMEIDLTGLPMVPFLDHGYRDGISEADVFTTGSKGYIATITEQVTSYAFWCDEDWDDDWFNTDQSMACNNIVSIGSIEDGTNADGTTDYDPVPATSFDEVISTPSELSAMTNETRSLGLWAGNSDNFQIKAYLQTDDGTSTGANPTVIFMKDFWNGPLFKVGEGSFSTETVGSSAIITWSVPGFVRQLGDRDHDEGNQFIFVDQDIIDGASQNILRRGEVRLENTVEHEFLFDANAKAQIISAFALTSPQPQAFLNASDNGVNFATGSEITMDQTFGVAGFGLLREWDTDTGGEVYEYYTFDVSGEGGRYVFEEKDNTGSVIDSADEAMTWSVTVEGNLEIVITSSSEAHDIALAEFSDTYRPQVVVLNAFEASAHNYSERMVSQTTFEAEVANRIDLSTEPLDDTSFTYINKNPDATQVETMIFNADGSWEWQIDTVTDETATWLANTTDSYISLDFGDGIDVVAIEDIFADVNDLDGDSDTIENIYLFTGWVEVDGATGLGSFFRDEFYKN